MFNKIIKKVSIFFIVFAIIFIFAEAIFLSLPYFLNSEKFIKSVENFLLKEKYLNLKTENISFKTYPDFTLKISADLLHLTNIDNQTIFYLNNFISRIKIINLLKKELNIKYFFANDLKIYAFIKDNKFYFKDKVFAYEMYELGYIPVIKNTQIILKNHLISVYEPNSSKFFIINGEYLNFKNNKYSKIATKGVIKLGILNSGYDIKANLISSIDKMFQDNNFEIDAKVKNLNLKELIYFCPFLKKENILSTNGILDIALKTEKESSNLNFLNIYAKLKNFNIKNKDKENSISLDGITSFESSINIDKNTLKIKKFLLKNVFFNFNLAGNIKDFLAKEPLLDLNLNIPTGKINYIMAAIPSEFSPKNHTSLISDIKKYGVYGDINANLKLKGSYLKPDIVGDVDIFNFYILENSKNISTSSIKLNFKKTYFELLAKVFTDRNQFVDIKGKSKLYDDEYGNYKIFSTPSINLEYAQNILIPLSEAFDFFIGPLKIMKFKGIGNIALNTEGTTKDANVNGLFNFINTDIKIEGINALFNNLTGKLIFDNKDFYFETSKAFLNNSPVSIKGHTTFYGIFDFDIISKKINSDDLVKIIKTSPLLKKEALKLNSIKNIVGFSDLNLKITGKIDENVLDNVLENTNYFGNLNLNKNNIFINYLDKPLSNVSGNIKFDKTFAEISLNALKDDFNIFINGKLDEKYLDINANSNKIDLYSALDFLSPDFISYKPYLNNLYLGFNFQYKDFSDKEDIDLKKINLDVSILPSFNKYLNLKKSFITLKNNNLNVNDFYISSNKTNFYTNGNIKNFFSNNPIFNLNFKLNNLNLNILNDINKLSFLSDEQKGLINLFNNYQGNIKTNGSVKNNKLNANITFNDLKFEQQNINLPISISNGNLVINNNNLKINAVNGFIGNAPIFFNLNILHLFTNPQYQGYFTTKLDDTFIDNVLNPHLTYPIRIKGDTLLSCDFLGSKNKINIKPKLKLLKDSDIFYMGINFDSTDLIRELYADITLTPTLIDFKKLLYSHYISSQNKLEYPVPFISAMGKIIKNKRKYYFNNFIIKTNKSTTAKLFNLIFKKSIIKEGSFNCDLKLNGNIKSPLLIGNLDLKNLILPSYNTKLEKLLLNIDKKNIHLDTQSKYFESNILLNAIIKNQLTLPFVIKKLTINTENLNANKILDTFSSVNLTALPNSLQTQNIIMQSSTLFNPALITIEKGKVEANKILLKNLQAADLEANFNLKNSILNLTDINFNIAQGNVSANANYNFVSGLLKGEFDANSVDANLVSEAVFDVKDQIEGKLNGQMKISTKGKNEQERIKNTNGEVYFQLYNGKMPKLGSLEYLLKAGNLIKGGISGLSINRIINLAIPLNTGNFMKIQGGMKLADGKVESIEIFSKGKDLSIYLKGSYDILEENADMQVWGKLANNITTILGPIGNASLNTLFRLIPSFNNKNNESNNFMEYINKIPNIDLSPDDVRVFNAKIDGNINGDNYVSSFNWIEQK